MSNSAEKVKVLSLDELLGNSSVPEETDNRVVEIPLEQLHTFKGHPFRVRDDEKMAELVDSITKFGVLVPGIARPRRVGGYEIIAGHCRKRGSQLAGRSTMPVIVKELSDAEATVIMVDSNIQREDLTCKEKAFAYRMKYEALKEMGLSEDAGDKRLDQALAEKSRDGRSTIQRYIRLTYLMSELLDMVDEKKLGFIAATDISYLKSEEQEQLLQLMTTGNIVPTGAQAEQLKAYSKEGKLNKTVMELLLRQEKTTNRLVIKEKQLKNYFPEDYDMSKMTEVIFMLLDQWKQQQN